MIIKEWAQQDMPREKLMRDGARNQTTPELLAILLSTGSHGENVVDLARRLMNDAGNSLNRLAHMSPSELMKTKGIGPAKAATISAAMELGHRISTERASMQTVKIKSSLDLYNEFVGIIGNLEHEEFWVILLSLKLSPLGIFKIAQGGINESHVDIRLIFKKALEVNATSIAVAHNHPSGDINPSHQDDLLTQRLKNAANALSIKFVDHIIIGTAVWYAPEQGQSCPGSSVAEYPDRPVAKTGVHYFSYKDSERLNKV